MRARFELSLARGSQFHGGTMNISTTEMQRARLRTATPGGSVRNYFQAYETKQRDVLEELFSADFTFTSPDDDHIDRARYFEKCWPGSQNIRSIHIEELVEDGREVIVRYKIDTKDRGSFKNVEVIFFDGIHIKSIEVYFGAKEAALHS